MGAEWFLIGYVLGSSNSAPMNTAGMCNENSSGGSCDFLLRVSTLSWSNPLVIMVVMLLAVIFVELLIRYLRKSRG